MDRFTKISHEGVALPADAGADDVGSIRLNATGLLVATKLPNGGKPAPWKKRTELAAAITLLGEPCRVPEVEEAFLIPDRSRYAPALDPQYFQFLIDAYENCSWMWTNTASASDPGILAWYVHLGSGSSYRGSQDSKGLLLAVRGPVSAPGQ